MLLARCLRGALVAMAFCGCAETPAVPADSPQNPASTAAAAADVPAPSVLSQALAPAIQVQAIAPVMDHSHHHHHPTEEPAPDAGAPPPPEGHSHP